MRIAHRCDSLGHLWFLSCFRWSFGSMHYKVRSGSTGILMQVLIAAIVMLHRVCIASSRAVNKAKATDYLFSIALMFELLEKLFYKIEGSYARNNRLLDCEHPFGVEGTV